MTCWQLDTYIWHFLEKQFHRNIKWVIWLDTYVQGWNRCATSKSPKPLPNEIQRNSKCSKLFNLKADGGTTNKKVHNQRVGKKRKRQANSCKSDKRTAKKAQKTHNQKQKKSDSVPSFWTMLNLKKSKRELSPAHIKRGYSGPGHLGGGL